MTTKPSAAAVRAAEAIAERWHTAEIDTRPIDAEIRPLIEALESIDYFAKRGQDGSADHAHTALWTIRKHAQHALNRAKGEG